MTVLNVTLVCPGFCWWLQGGRHKVEPHACGQRQKKEAQKISEQISAQNYPNLKQIAVLEIHFLNRSTFSLNIVQKSNFGKIWKLTYI
jgi:hypothetical protein